MSEIPQWAAEIRQTIRRERDGTISTQHLCRLVERTVEKALEATDKAARERSAQIGYVTCAVARHVTLGREVEKNILAGDLDAAIRKGTE